VPVCIVNALVFGAPPRSSRALMWTVEALLQYAGLRVAPGPGRELAMLNSVINRRLHDFAARTRPADYREEAAR
jgi:hypothetical protein